MDLLSELKAHYRLEVMLNKEKNSTLMRNLKVKGNCLVFIVVMLREHTNYLSEVVSPFQKISSNIV